MDAYKRKVPVGIRPTPGHVPSTVFNSDSLRNENGYSNNTSVYMEERKSQRIAQNQLRHEEQLRDLEMLNNYNPWGKPGGGAPRNSGPQMMKLEKSLNDSGKADGSLVEYLSRPGGGAPLRTESGHPIGVVRVHPDIRNTREHLNETDKKKTVVNGVRKSSGESDAEPRFHKAQLLGGREKTSEEMKNNLKERLSKQVDEKRASLLHEKEDRNTPETTDWMNGKVGYIQRNSSGKIKRSEPLAQRGADGVREYYDNSGDKSIVEQLGRPGPGVAMRTVSGNVHSQPRGMPTNYDDPFRPGINKSPVNQVFPVDIEHEAKERAWKRHPVQSPHFNKHSIENGYYIDQDKAESAWKDTNGQNGHDKPIGTVYSAVLRTKGNYLEDLRAQMSEKQEMKERERKQSLDQDYQHIKSSDIFGRPGNGAPRLQDGSLRTTRNKLEELETVSDGMRHPGAFRGLH